MEQSNETSLVVLPHHGPSDGHSTRAQISKKKGVPRKQPILSPLDFDFEYGVISPDFEFMVGSPRGSVEKWSL
jgi:hypothetical protein